MVRKKRKIYDCFFYFDEIELLNLRLDLLNENVDKFIIMEFDEDFSFIKKEKFLDLNEISNNLVLEKISILRIPPLNKETIIQKFQKFSDRNGYLELQKRNFSYKDIQKYALYCLVELLISEKLSLEDFIFVSDVDEIPDFNFLEDIGKFLPYGPVHLKNTNFIWSEKFKLLTNHSGSILFNLSQILINNKIIQENYFFKNKFRGKNISINCGWHLSHFYDIDRTLKKFKLLYPEMNLNRNSFINSFKNFEYPIENIFGVKEPLVENENQLPFDTKMLPKPYMGRKNHKKILINLDMKIFHDNGFFDSIFEFKIDEKYLPQKKLYQDSEKYYTMNEIPKFLNNKNLLSHDLIFILLDPNVSLEELNFNSNYVDENKRFAIFDWKTLKKNIVSDLIFQNSTSQSQIY